ncbi:hypothetical protein FDG95_gp374 [Pectobacterium phage vB_PcaM_CBB]|uniref:Uncharacterized protein n=1 Tax=Pectobacterium phage vB_PcaM_CBB TaxID=2772511 RepID=A0A1L2CUE8_9CAUD|nr:hypothetical protein FDG95_gp052 [Pectobacterium phage vB_PcaM_CBB]YP_009595145.1 hypothetical protein FDG95_gp374 [Pectobacterium phage vB_PcaM_CBB]AMM43617.1 hypothetical protein CBB_52 [Pectobacterium phage vB_PcaM_CBB]AMM44168.1 hypothetical protein CBB_605 [Pectobacterium phage vB_PcaM_CBB]
MTIIALLSSVAAVANLADVDSVIIMDGENNYYDDSDFYYVGVNIKTGEYFKHYHSTTRAYGFRDLPKSVCINALADNVQEDVRAMYKQACINEARRLMDTDYDYIISTGDTVKVTNTRARKHKGETFVVTHTSTYEDNYGRTQTVYLHGGDDVKTSRTNCTRIAVGDAVINKVAERLAVGLAIKF